MPHGTEGCLLHATIRTHVWPHFHVDVHLAYEPDGSCRQRYVLTLSDGTLGHMQLIFASARDLQSFLRMARQALASARRMARSLRSPRKTHSPTHSRQATFDLR